MKKSTIKINGMTCGSCKKLIEDIAGDYKEIKSFVIDFAAGQAETEYEENFDWGKFQKELSKVGEYTIAYG